MKKLVILSLTLAGIAGMSGCDGNWYKTNVPEAVEKSFINMHPTAERVEWDVVQGFYEVDFEISTRERSAVFSADGTLIKYSEEIQDQYLPAAALEYLQEKYANQNIDEVHRVLQNQKTFFKVELENENDELVLLFNEKGLLQEQQSLITEAASFAPATAAPTTHTNAPQSPSSLPVPEAKWELPAELREVSGIALLENNILACVQDEEGIIYLYDLNKKAVTRKIEFAEGGDYEGIAVVENSAFVLRSDGALYEVTPLLDGQPKTSLYKTVLAKTQDTEGLAYDKANNRLLIAPKGYDERLGDNKGIYAFSLADKKMQQKPVITIPLAQEKLKSGGKKQKSKYDALQPSSLEIHEATGELYLLDAENFLLLSIDQQGQIQKLISLDKDQLRQPEGFTFSNSGDLYISSEGSKKGNGVILQFTNGF
ncbi:hypothetical protein D770_22210 [Flammeovirgaceae bacterium 311]|nr:hypothetical protein D770_22210 [Flammeovirgaceae bacterium 311]